ncbi:MAG: VOC family protein [Bacteroidia bacterium]|nr:VOC family protein [Bacteroidia bacterium]NNM23756.1 VOC family protein [Flavobacteriaceae bacterium]
MTTFQIEHLDHVAIRVKDLVISAKWYQDVLGLTRYDVPEWGQFPIFMMAGTTGLALFPAKLGDPEFDRQSRNVKIDHFAFNVTNENFEQAKTRYEELGIHYQFQDHFYFHSIYTPDPDGHTVELTTLVKERASFYEDLKA